jgi:predicted transcriptional regulator
MIPPRGYQNELAKAIGCSRQTVINALRHRQRGAVSEQVRQLYKVKYCGAAQYVGAADR